MDIDKRIAAFLNDRGADFVYFVDISELPEAQKLGFSRAVLFGMALSPAYLKRVSSNPNYVKDMLRNRETETDEFHQKEIQTDALADALAEYLKHLEFDALSQSEKELEAQGFYNLETQSTVLPNKTIAQLAGFGWVGKHNLLITKEYGSAFSMCTVLTNAPVKTRVFKLADENCGDCSICFEACIPGALTNRNWHKESTRDEMLLVHKCLTCLQCMVQCPFTQKYMTEN